MAKKFDPKAKAKKQKIIAAVGGVILLGVLAFQVPRTLKMLHQPSTNPSASTPSATSAPTTPIAAPSLSGGNATTAAAVTEGDGLIDPDTVPTPQSGQLLAFGLFRTKDPFVQQLDTTCGSATDGASGPTSCSSGAGAAGATGSKGAIPNAGATAARPKGAGARTLTVGPAPAAAAPTSAEISVNGSSETVGLGAQFPASDHVFTLVSLTKSSARVGIAGGSLESGAATVTLKKNKPVTLLNTADGTRYVLRLLSLS